MNQNDIQNDEPQDKPNRGERKRSNKRNRSEANKQLRRVSGSNWKDYLRENDDEETLSEDS